MEFKVECRCRGQRFKYPCDRRKRTLPKYVYYTQRKKRFCPAQTAHQADFAMKFGVFRLEYLILRARFTCYVVRRKSCALLGACLRWVLVESTRWIMLAQFWRGLCFSIFLHIFTVYIYIYTYIISEPVTKYKFTLQKESNITPP